MVMPPLITLPEYTIVSVTPVSSTELKVTINVTAVNDGGRLACSYDTVSHSVWYEYANDYDPYDTSITATGNYSITVPSLTPSTFYYYMVSVRIGGSYVSSKPEGTVMMPGAGSARFIPFFV